MKIAADTESLSLGGSPTVPFHANLQDVNLKEDFEIVDVVWNSDFV